MKIRLTLIAIILLLSFGNIFAQSKTVIIKLVETSFVNTGILSEAQMIIIDADGEQFGEIIETHIGEGIFINMKTLKDVL